MNPFIAALYDNLSFCPSGCGACISALRGKMEAYAGGQANEWEIIAALQPSELTSAPHWDQRLRHLLWKSGEYPHLDQIIAGWLESSHGLPINQSHLAFVDFLIWDICHKMNAMCNIDDTLFSAAIQHSTELAERAVNDFFGTVEFDSLVESLLIIRNTDRHYHDGLTTLLNLPWQTTSRTGHILHTSSL